MNDFICTGALPYFLHRGSRIPALCVLEITEQSSSTGIRLMRPIVAALGVVIGLQSGAMVDLQADDAGWAQAPAAAAAQAAAAVRSRITVTVPFDETELTVDGSAIVGEGTSRQFQSPPLESGKTYQYKFTARWRPNNWTVLTRNKTVQFRAGDDVTVDLMTDDPNDRAVIIYVPTWNSTVEQMIALADVNKDDVVYEPGCGDARITIAAVRAGAKRGVGIDLDPVLVAEAKANVKAAGLDDKIDIRLGDALDVKDLSDATVVFLYMADEFDMLIRPILWKQLRVGARIVSHRFTMGDWQPDKSVNDDGIGKDGLRQGKSAPTVYLWTITKEIKERALKN
ncbi:MAG: TIGR03000 domain-containing protein [Betaproteobacteria bacterium]